MEQRNEHSLNGWGAVLILLGLVFLFENLLGQYLPVSLWSLVFLIGGGAFLARFFTRRDSWWAVIPGSALAAIGVLIALSTVWPALSDDVGGLLVLGALGLGFVSIYIARHDEWWALIPGGALLTLAIVSVMGYWVEEAVPSVFFLGLAATFGLVYLAPLSPRSRQRWAIYPMGVLLLMGLGLSFLWSTASQFLLPLALIAGGGYLVMRNWYAR